MLRKKHLRIKIIKTCSYKIIKNKMFLQLWSGYGISFIEDI